MLEVVTPEQQKFTSENGIKLAVVFQKLKDKKRILILIPHVEFKQYEDLSLPKFLHGVIISFFVFFSTREHSGMVFVNNWLRNLRA